jgi:hypothetical protein
VLERALMPRVALTAALAATLSLGAAPARADVPLPTRIEYHAPPNCPPASEFEKRLRARAPRVRLVASGSAPRTLYVEIVRRADGMAGTLRVGDGADRRRNLKAARCEDTVDGLALVAAVALDPEGPSGPAPPDEPPPAPTPAAPSPEPPANPPPPRPEPAPSPNSPPSVLPPNDLVRSNPEADRDTRRPAPRSPPTEDFWHLLAGVGAGGLFGQAPGALPAFMFLFGTEWYVSPFWAPSLRVSIVQTAERDFNEPGGIVQYRTTLGMGEACPFRFGPPQLAFRPCLAGAAGVATISGSQTQGAESHSRGRWYLGGSGLMALGVSKDIDVTAAAGILVPMRRDSYQFMPTVFFSDPAVSEFVRLGVSVAFP